jgi:acetyl esterase/lipase
MLAFPIPPRHPDVERATDVVYHRVGERALKLDVYRHRSRPRGCPALLFVHGGAWVVGSKAHQGLPLMQHLASLGWVCFGIDYRLSPRATFPEHLVDVKRAIQWVREHGGEHGADPRFLVVSGNSAGGHLAALAALTPNDPEYQPGFADADTSVAACVSFYGVYDFADRHGHWRNRGIHRLLEEQVMKVSPADAPEAYDRASPIARIGEGAPPFLVVHGDQDTLVPVGEARRFVEAFRAEAHAPIAYAEIPGAQHAFDVFPSVRTVHVLGGVERFCAWLYSRHLAERAG